MSADASDPTTTAASTSFASAPATDARHERETPTSDTAFDTSPARHTSATYRPTGRGDDPPIESDDDPTTKLLAESLASTDCGGNGRDFCCAYHEGVADGLDAAFAWVREADGE